MGTQLSYTSGPGGYSANTSGTTGVPSAYGGNGDVMNFFKILAQRRVAGTDAPPVATPAFAPVPQPSYALEEGRLAMQAREDAARDARAGGPTEQEWEGAATRPTGLGAQMIPGMAVDQRLIPRSMRPNSASMTGGPRPLVGDGPGDVMGSTRQNMGGPNIGQPAEPSFAERYFKQFGRLPTAGQQG